MCVQHFFFPCSPPRGACQSAVVTESGGEREERGGGRGEGPGLSPPPGQVARSVAAGQVDGLSGEGAAGELGHGLPGRLPAGEGHQGLPAPLAAQVVQDEDGVRLELLRLVRDRATLWAESGPAPDQSAAPRCRSHQERTGIPGRS